jgi:hypothetical protein
VVVSEVYAGRYCAGRVRERSARGEERIAERSGHGMSIHLLSLNLLNGAHIILEGWSLALGSFPSIKSIPALPAMPRKPTSQSAEEIFETMPHRPTAVR